MNKLTEKQLREILHNKAVNPEAINPKKVNISIPVEINGVKMDENVSDIVGDVLAYKKAHKPKRNDVTITGIKDGVIQFKPEGDVRADTPTDEKPYRPHFHTDWDYDKSSYENMSDSEKQELKDLIAQSKRITKAIDARKTTGEIPYPVSIDNLVRDEKLINEWKEYKQRVNTFIEKHKKFPSVIAKAFLLDEYPEEEKCLAGVPWEVNEFKKITDSMFETYKKKNADYGSSFDDLFDEFGMTSALLRMKDKYNRLKSITEKGEIQVKDESVEDTLLDLANYAVLTVIRLRRDKQFTKKTSIVRNVNK